MKPRTIYMQPKVRSPSTVCCLCEDSCVTYPIIELSIQSTVNPCCHKPPFITRCCKKTLSSSRLLHRVLENIHGCVVRKFSRPNKGTCRSVRKGSSEMDSIRDICSQSSQTSTIFSKTIFQLERIEILEKTNAVR